MLLLPILIFVIGILLITLCKFVVPAIVRKILAKSIVAKAGEGEENSVSEPVNATQTFKRLKLFIFGSGAVGIVYFITLFSIALSVIVNRKAAGNYITYTGISFLAVICYAIIIIGVQCFRRIRKTENNAEKCDLKFLKKIFNSYINWMVFLPTILLLASAYSFLNLVMPVYINSIFNTVLWLTLLYVALFAVCVVGVKVGKKLITSFYGVEALVDNQKAVEVLSVSRLLEMRNEELSKVEKEEKVSLSQRLKGVCGSAVSGIKTHKSLAIRIGCVFLAYLIVLIISLVMLARSSDIFRVPVVLKVTNIESAELYLGEPTMKTVSGNNYVYEYYSGEYGKIVKKIDNLTKKAEKAESLDELAIIMEEQANLAKKLDSLDYKFIKVSESSGSFSVYYDANAGKNGNSNKWSENNKGRIELCCYSNSHSYSINEGFSRNEIITINSGTDISMYSGKNVLARIYYNDGSYAFYSTSYKTDDLNSGENYLSWADGWGSYTVTLKI